MVLEFDEEMLLPDQINEQAAQYGYRVTDISQAMDHSTVEYRDIDDASQTFTMTLPFSSGPDSINQILDEMKQRRNG
jgi:hypothetical protein